MAELRDVTTLDARPTDADLANQYRARMRAILEPAALLMAEARAHGLEIGFSIATDQYGRPFIPPITVTKPL